MRHRSSNPVPPGNIVKTFGNALRGLKIAFREERNIAIHLAVMVLSIALGFALRISAREWMAVVLATGAVFAAELANTTIENIADFIAPQWHESMQRIKDLAAAAVLVTALAALAVGAIVFLPKLWVLVH